MRKFRKWRSRPLITSVIMPHNRRVLKHPFGISFVKWRALNLIILAIRETWHVHGIKVGTRAYTYMECIFAQEIWFDIMCMVRQGPWELGFLEMKLSSTLGLCPQGMVVVSVLPHPRSPSYFSLIRPLHLEYNMCDYYEMMRWLTNPNGFQT